ncbi:family 43 glycosylhydrolase [Blastococcus sp. SYSU D00820]
MTGTFTNPVVRGVSPDPSVCRVGDDFFLATSTFDFWPGIPIHHSTDLVHWELIGHAVTRPEQFRPGGGDGAFVLYAPTLRYSEGTFYVACTNTAPLDPALGRRGGNVGNFIVSTTDPAGEWSDAAWVDGQAFDPSLLFADGTCYYTRRSFDLANAATGLGPIVQAEVDPSTGRLAAAPRPITEGVTGFCSNDIEGPHLYQVGDTYYLFAAEGGTERGHMQTVARSSSPWGPFEPAPTNPVLTHRHRMLHPIQCTGHAELVQAPDGRWWALFLATRADRLGGPDLLGRETFLAPVEWRDGWPVIGNGGTVELEMPAPGLPRSPGRERGDAPWLAGWSTRHFPVAGLTVDAAVGRVQLPVTPARLDDEGAVSAVFLRQTEHSATFTATIDRLPPATAAGVTAYTGSEHHYDLAVTSDDRGRRVTLRRRAADLVAETAVALPGDGPVTLTIACDGAEYRFGATTAAGTVGVGSGAARLLDASHAPGFGSVRLGVFATGAAGGTVDVSGVGGQSVG